MGSTLSDRGLPGPAGISATSQVVYDGRTISLQDQGANVVLSTHFRPVQHPPKKSCVFVFEPRIYMWQVEPIQELVRKEPVFRDTIRRCDHIARKSLGWSLVEELAKPSESSGLSTREEFFDLTVVAVEIAQLELWRQRGLEPDAVMGLSGGEITAAYAAGVFSL